MFEVGDEVAGYRVEAVLGAGGMGEVYRVRHPRLPRSDAMKVLRSSHASDPVVRARFEREADLVAPLVHPNLVRVYDRGALNDVLWIAMEMVPGTDASKIVKQSPGGLDARLVANIVDGVAAGLDVAHRFGVLHRDVKPANILITPGQDPILPDAVKVTDFGIAQALGDAAGELTSTGTTVGTMRYCSPEQIDGRAVDGRTDLYSLAATTFELLTGSSPYESTSIQGLMTAHMFAEPPRASERNRSLSPAVDAVIAVGLAKDPTQRPPSCLAFAQALRTALFTGRGPVVPPSFVNTPGAPVRNTATGTFGPNTGQPPPPNSAATPWYRRVPVVASAAVVLAAAIGIGGGFAWASGGGLETPTGVQVDATAKGVEMSWDSVSGASEYLIKEDDEVIRTVSDTSFTYTTPFPGEHTYSVAARSTTKGGSDFSSSDPVDVSLTWGVLGDVAAMYPQLLPATPVSTGGFDGLECRAEGPRATDRRPAASILCTKDSESGAAEYQVRIFVYPDHDNASLGATSRTPIRDDSEYNKKSAQNRKGMIHTGVEDGESRSVFTFDDDADPHARTFVEVAYPGTKNTKQARDLLGRLPF
ncbi:serine/threonine protein kinase [Gordonia sp. HY442]|uniref:serine/threonine-protein kinase n=1 Tax=Gordonia zhenghanii TaxID=2911516 RepID=UPI001F3BC8D0|nr:serine/threonine-protein kinase [Gordonia zhenghanii]MCF8603061.1 serine/threonine protein kinase [Gordonia zhenghanii]